jgi:hypothetical protein
VFGNVVGRLVDENLADGTYDIECSPSVLHLAAGVYWVVLTGNEGQSIRKLVVR